METPARVCLIKSHDGLSVIPCALVVFLSCSTIFSYFHTLTFVFRGLDQVSILPRSDSPTLLTKITLFPLYNMAYLLLFLLCILIGSPIHRAGSLLPVSPNSISPAGELYLKAQSQLASTSQSNPWAPSILEKVLDHPM